MRVGIVGSGRLGAPLGRLLSAAGHDVLFSDARLTLTEEAAVAAEGQAGGGSPIEAARFGEVVVMAVWWEAFPTVVEELGPVLAGKIVIDPSNPITERDGAEAVVAVPGGLTSPQYQQHVLGPGVRLVRTFNTKYPNELLDLGMAGQRGGPRADMPYWGDDDAAKKAVVPLIEDAGFTAIDGGGLADAL
ncbi:NADP oxidoreductase [Nonomuraea sp. WAC 01424]|uniref:NADPH-dependent F420 reductase n=1 Tax=Nonomuraea sp. WAC 01424 TaxID=2203200 RepID=UPI000F7AC1C7|nr:NAD(P)-binding domain-containing protein [Nonomuraea sp. WAC 01424]RSN03464.1 NADP oxidoreductase [Nonomuraea sp. WAC 01424]